MAWIMTTFTFALKLLGELKKTEQNKAKHKTHTQNKSLRFLFFSPLLFFLSPSVVFSTDFSSGFQFFSCCSCHAILL